MSLQQQPANHIPGFSLDLAIQDSRQRVFAWAREAVDIALAGGHILVVNAKAERLLREHPCDSLSKADLRDAVAILAVHRRVPIQLG